MSLPVVVLAYANDNDNPLEWLEPEHNAIANYFLSIRNSIQLLQIPNATRENLFDALHKCLDDVIIFHFSGHANQDVLRLKKGDGEKVGLAQLMGQAKNLKLVFLNGCATYGHVEDLHANNVNSVIATHQPVEDHTASEFARTFYSGLCSYRSTKKSFDYAKAFVLSGKSSATFSRARPDSRSIGIEDEDRDSGAAWGIFYKKHADADIQRKLFEDFESWSLPDNEIGPAPLLNYSPNMYLIESIASNSENFYNQIKSNGSDSLIDPGISTEFEELIKYYKFDYNGKPDKFNRLANRIKNIMPFPMASRLEKMTQLGTDILKDKRLGLVDYDKFYKLIKSQLSLYETLVKLCGLTMVSDLFNLLLKSADKSSFKITSGQYEYLNEFVSINESTAQDFDYTNLIRTIREIFEANITKPYIAEYEILKEQFIYEKDLFESHMQLMSIKDRLNRDKISTYEVESYCNKIEHVLWNVLSTVYFIMRYKLVVIKRIEIIKFRNDSPTYNHNMMVLHQSVEDTWPEDEYPSDSKFTDSYSVMVLKGLSSFTEYLNLSPFSIDLNVLQGDESSLLYLYTYTRSDGTLVYEQVQDNGKTLPIKLRWREEEDRSTIVIDYVEGLTKKSNPEKKKITARMYSVWRQFQNFRIEIALLQKYVKD